jgi:hypothetical protein
MRLCAREGRYLAERVSHAFAMLASYFANPARQ